MKAVLLGLLAWLAVTDFLAAQPSGTEQPTSVPALRIIGINKITERRKADIAGRILRSIVDRGAVAASVPPNRVLDTRLGSVAAGLQQDLEAYRLRQIQARKRDPQFLGVIDSVVVGGTEISLERRRVRTDRGVQTLLLNRINGEYIYDGDQVVPWTAIEGSAPSAGGPVVFSAGVPGTFGKGTLWDDALIPFEVEPGFCCRPALANAIAFYEANTIFRFVPRDGHETYVRFINAEPFTHSGTTGIGKQRGENTIRIQGHTLRDGQPRPLDDLTNTIQHEIGHLLGLIHEHVRADRDQFIARNPNCTPRDIFQSIYEGWIDIGQTAFTDDSAELLTPYDFDSAMHYPFRLDRDGDGLHVCSTWVRIGTCPGRDPSSPLCNGRFEPGALTARDIEGLHRLYIRIPNDREVRTFTGDNVRHRGRRIDRCLHGAGLDGCSVAARDRVANEFCRAYGFENGFDVLTESMWGEHSGFDTTVGWKNVWGTDVISSIVCQGLTRDAEDIRNDDLRAETIAQSDVNLSGRRIDRCVHGERITGDRCSLENQQRIANGYCELRGLERSSGFKNDFAIEANAIGFFPASNDFRNVSSLDIFTEITCVTSDAPRPVDTFGTFTGDQVRHRGRLIDRCLHGVGFREDGCSEGSRAVVADEFCRTRGFQHGDSVIIRGMVGEHSGYDRAVGWKNVWGADVISSIRCNNRTAVEAAVRADTMESRRFRDGEVTISGRLIDRCVHGDGIVGDRCSTANQRRIARQFCELNQFDRSSGFVVDSRVVFDAIGFYPSSNDFRNVSSADIFTEITCVRQKT